MKKVLFLTLFFHSLLLLHSEIKPQFRFALDFSANPYVYEFTMPGTADCFNGSVMLGVNLGKVSLGLAMDEHYFAFSTNNFYGAFNIMRWLLHCYVRPVHWFQLTIGAGGSMLHSAFDYNATGTFSKFEGGFAARLDIAFIPVRWFSIDLVNRLDLFIYPKVSPEYYGGLRFIFHPFLEWVGFYVEAGGMPWLYHSTPHSFTTGLFMWAAGCKVDLTVPGDIRNSKADYTAAVDRFRSMQKMRKAQVGESIAVNSILFQSNTADLLPSSYVVLEKILRFLRKRKSITIEIGGHTNKVGNIQAQIKLSAERARKVAQYLVYKGIAENRITIKGYGGSDLIEEGVNELNRRVEIKILSL